jgi:magnesium-transporting ATPase (P-type)
VPPPVPWHARSAAQVAEGLGSDLEHGLAPDEAARRLRQSGPNALPESRRRSLLRVFLAQLASPLIYLLLVAAVIAGVLGELTDALVIVAVLLLNAVIGAVQEGRAERALAALRREARHEARVRRGGVDALISARDVVPGDLIVLEPGDAIPADARLVEVTALEVAEAALTGESLPVAKQVAALAPETGLGDRRNLVHAGTLVTAGRAHALVVGTGADTELGRIASLTESAQAPATPLERRIAEVGRFVIVGAVVVFAIVLSVGLLRGVRFAEIFLIAVSTLVGMVPEGLPVAVTIGLAVGVQRMARRRAVVRRLQAVETLGSTTVICTDKTGTLTRNEMTVTAIFLPDGRQLSVSGIGYTPVGRFSRDGEAFDPDPALVQLLEAGVLCNDAELEHSDDSRATPRPIGDPTEVALLTAAIKGGLDPAGIRARSPRRAALPFAPADKMMATQHDSGTSRGAFVVLKGAPEAILALCGTRRHAEGSVALDESERRAVREAAEQMSARALRLLAIAVAEATTLDAKAGFRALAGRATFLGLVGELDPPREEVADAVTACRAAGIRPVVVTGDHKGTGLAVAQRLGIAREGDMAIDGVELDALSDTALDERLDRISVFARVHPGQKLRIVEAYQRRREVVAMTGDGVNDAPALVRADVGVAMGVTGTEVAKEAAAIVIGDDDFATIVAAVEEGRVVYRNIKKAVLLLFSTSAAEVLVLLLAMLLGFPPPLAAVQILWNNLVTEGLVTVNLVMEPAEGDELRRPPISPDEPLLTRLLLTRGAVMTTAIVASTLGWFLARSAAGVPVAQIQTETFALLAICEWFNTLNCRSESKSALTPQVFRNRWLLGGLLAANILLALAIFWRPLGEILHTVPFGLREFVSLGLVGSVVLWAEEARKLGVRLFSGARRPAVER